MTATLSNNVFRFILLIALQIMIFNNINLTGYIIPYIYILFILLLPFQVPGWLLLILGASLGLSIDIFMDTLGLHASSTVFMAFLRPYVLKSIEPRDGYETGTKPTVAFYGIKWYLRYAGILVVAHHFILFFLETFRFGDFFSTFARVLISSSITLIVIVLSQYIVFRK